MVGQLIPPLLLLLLDPGSEIRDPGWIKIRIRDPESTLETKFRIFYLPNFSYSFVYTVTVLCQYTYVDYKICLTLRNSTNYIILWRETRYCT